MTLIPHYDDSQAVLYLGDVRVVLRSLPEASVLNSAYLDMAAERLRQLALMENLGSKD